MKKFLRIFACAVFILSAAFSITAYADYVEPTVTVTINDKIVEFDVAPVIENGRTLVPIRAVSEQDVYFINCTNNNYPID